MALGETNYFPEQLFPFRTQCFPTTLREKYPNTRPKTPYSDTFHTVQFLQILECTEMKEHIGEVLSHFLLKWN